METGRFDSLTAGSGGVGGWQSAVGRYAPPGRATGGSNAGW